MADSIQTILQQAGLATAPFPATSRYYGIEVAQLATSAQAPVAYVRRRILPSPERFSLLQEHLVSEEERLDNITNRYLGDPQQFWRICDANGVMDPNELTDTTGATIRITLPEGIPGYSNA